MSESRPSERPAPPVHFATWAVQEHSLRLGMWIFLASEILLFAGLFALYTGYRTMYGEAFAAGVKHDNVVIGTVNTFILICSSFTVALSLSQVRHGRVRLAMLLLGLSILLGCVFLVLKGVEWSEHFREGVLPGRRYHFSELPTFGANTFFTLYFFMTGLHALHVLGGLGVLTYFLIGIARGVHGPLRYVPFECGTLYWHLVDIIWFFLWPLFYLAR